MKDGIYLYRGFNTTVCSVENNLATKLKDVNGEAPQNWDVMQPDKYTLLYAYPREASSVPDYEEYKIAGDRYFNREGKMYLVVSGSPIKGMVDA